MALAVDEEVPVVSPAAVVPVVPAAAVAVGPVVSVAPVSPEMVKELYAPDWQ